MKSVKQPNRLKYMNLSELILIRHSMKFMTHKEPEFNTYRYDNESKPNATSWSPKKT